MDSVSLREDRARVSDQLQAKLTSLGTLRARLANAKTDAGRRLLYDAAAKQADCCRELSAQLIVLDDLISAVQSQARQDEQVPVAPNRPLERAPLDFEGLDCRLAPASR
jgi:hypothetical protein